MAMVRSLELVLNQHPAIGPDFFAQNVSPERSDGALLCLQFQVDAKRLAQHRQVLRTGQPRREVRRLSGPDIARFDAFKATQILCHTTDSRVREAGASASNSSASSSWRRVSSRLARVVSSWAHNISNSS